MSWTGAGTCPVCGQFAEVPVEPLFDGKVLVGTVWYCPVCGAMTQQLTTKEER